ncbi:hypothetical protein BSKO_09464 [Bryopsis sp. KO-2023]|nr:hypothetical protein BSKO_09464 [Bryopsis sp. KO-2023]
MSTAPVSPSAAGVVPSPPPVASPAGVIESKGVEKVPKSPSGPKMPPPITPQPPPPTPVQHTVAPPQAALPTVATPALAKGGCPKGSDMLSKMPEKLTGEKLSLQTGTGIRMVMVTSYDGVKGLHTITANGKTEQLKLSECNWSLTSSTPTPMNAQQENNSNNAVKDQMDFEEEARAKRKRPLRATSKLEAAGDKMKGSIPAKGRRPYRPGGCKVGRLMDATKLIGTRVHMWSSKDSVYYPAGVTSVDEKGLHTVLYLDGTSEQLNMAEAIWRMATSEFDYLYPDDFHIKSNAITPNVDNRETRRRRGNSGQALMATPKNAAEGLLALATGGGGMGGAGRGGTPTAGMNVGTPKAGAGQPSKDNAGQDRSGGSGTAPRQSGTGNNAIPGKSMASGGGAGAGEESKAGEDGQKQPSTSGEGTRKLVASSLEFQVHKVENPDKGYHVLCSVPAGTRISDVHVTCGNACIIIEHGKNEAQQGTSQGVGANPSGCSRLVILLPEPIRPSSASAKLTQGGKLAVFTALASA